MLASWLSRLLVGILDIFMGWAPLGFAALLWLLPSGHLWLAGIIMFAGCWVIFMALLGRGLTPGKLVMGIRAVRQDGFDPGWGLGFIREAVIKRVLGTVLWLFTGLYYTRWWTASGPSGTPAARRSTTRWPGPSSSRAGFLPPDECCPGPGSLLLGPALRPEGRHPRL